MAGQGTPGLQHPAVLDRTRADALGERVAEHHPQRADRGEGLQVAFVPGLGVGLDLVLDQADAGQQATGEAKEPARGAVVQVRVLHSHAGPLGP
jgi:hypothetical protein